MQPLNYPCLVPKCLIYKLILDTYSYCNFSVKFKLHLPNYRRDIILIRLGYFIIYQWNGLDVLIALSR